MADPAVDLALRKYLGGEAVKWVLDLGTVEGDDTILLIDFY